MSDTDQTPIDPAGESPADNGRRAAPARAARAVPGRPHLTPRTLALAAGALVVMIGLVLGLSALAKRSGPNSPTAVSTSLLALPATVADYTRDPARGSSPSQDAPGTLSTVSATYSRGGRSQFLVVALRPATDASSVMSELQATNIRPVGTGVCGRTRERQQDACTVVQRGTAVLVITEVEQTQDEMVSIAQKVADSIG